jgi:hypothetical protein
MQKTVMNILLIYLPRTPVTAQVTVFHWLIQHKNSKIMNPLEDTR